MVDATPVRPIAQVRTHAVGSPYFAEDFSPSPRLRTVEHATALGIRLVTRHGVSPPDCRGFMGILHYVRALTVASGTS